MMMARSRAGPGAWLPPCPIQPLTPAERIAQSAMIAAVLQRTLREAELRKARKVRTTPEQRARKAAQDDVRKLRALLGKAADAARWARVETALDGFAAFECRAKADVLRAKLTWRTAKVYAKAAAGCMVSAEFIADESADGLYRAALTEMAG